MAIFNSKLLVYQRVTQKPIISSWRVTHVSSFQLAPLGHPTSQLGPEAILPHTVPPDNSQGDNEDILGKKTRNNDAPLEFHQDKWWFN